MYLSRLMLNAGHNRTRSELDCPYEMHRTISKAWDDPSSARILFRPDRDSQNVVSVIVQSLAMPDWQRLSAPDDFLLRAEGPKEVSLNGLASNQKLSFRLRCRPCKRVGKAGGDQARKRVGLTSSDEILTWLHRKAGLSGFEIHQAGFDRIYWYDTKNGKKNSPIGAVVFDGILIVTDPNRLRETVRYGIGTQKAFGFGLLSLAPFRG